MNKRRDCWSDLPNELLEIILKRLTLADYLRFGRVCKSWRSVSSENWPPLWLMMPSYDGCLACPFFCPSDNKLYTLQLPEMVDNSCLGSSHGWLIMRDVQRHQAISLFNPFTKARIRLPSFPFSTSFHKVILSTAPPKTKADTDCVVLGIVAYDWSLYFCRLGDRKWRTFVGARAKHIHDVVFYMGQFYAVNDDGRVVVCDLEARPARVEVLRAQILRQKTPPSTVVYYYLVESCGELLLVQRLKTRGHYQQSKTTGFRVSKLDHGRLQWTGVKSLGDSALFLGSYYSLCVSAQWFLGCKENCIYFIDNTCHNYFSDHNGNFYSRGRYMNEFDLETKRIQTCLPRDVRRIWPPHVWGCRMPH